MLPRLRAATVLVLCLAIVSALALVAALPVAPTSAQSEPLRVTICEIQGSGATSPLVKALVTTEGVVTADLLETDSHGFFAQDESCDDDPATSDGIWVYVGNGDQSLDIDVGQAVEITGTVNEYFGLTELMTVTVAVLGAGRMPDPVPIDAPQDPTEATSYLEALEAMLVSLPPSNVVAATNRYGEACVMPTDAGIDRILRSDEQDGRLLCVTSVTEWLALDRGDEVTRFVGPLTYSYGRFEVLASADATGETDVQVTPSGLEPPAAPPRDRGAIRIGTYNLENLFDPVDDPGKNDSDSTPTQAQYEIELAARALSIVDHLGPPDVLGVQEVENRQVLTDLATLVSERVEHRTGTAPDMKSELLEGDDGRGIDVGFLYNHDTVRLRDQVQQEQVCTAEPLEGLTMECELPDGGTGHLLYSRPPLVGRFETVSDGARFTVIVNHF
ncbi:MAG: hypothetical protein ACK2UL_09285, partial [Anaerolineae bacterium]